MLKLTEKIKFYVPSTGENSDPVDADEHEHRASDIARLFARFFGGSSIINARGFWLDNDDHLIEESIKQVISFASSSDLDDHYDHLLRLAITFGQAWYQDSIAIELNDDLLLIEASSKIE